MLIMSKKKGSRQEIAMRRRQVAKMRYQDKMEVEEIAEKIGFSIMTVYKDLRWAEVDENRIRLMKEGTLEKPKKLVPAENKEEKQLRAQALNDLVESNKSYYQISKETGLSIETIANDLNKLAREIGHWGGRSMEDWRDQQLIEIDNLMVEAIRDSRVQPEMGDDGKWIITPYQAAQSRSSGRSDAIRLMERRAKLLGIDQQKQEIEITKNFVVAQIGGVDLDAFDHAIDGEYEEVKIKELGASKENENTPG
jgi:DNA-binding CsgD family transcriptional regulator